MPTFSRTSSNLSNDPIQDNPELTLPVTQIQSVQCPSEKEIILDINDDNIMTDSNITVLSTSSLSPKISNPKSNSSKTETPNLSENNSDENETDLDKKENCQPINKKVKIDTTPIILNGDEHFNYQKIEHEIYQNNLLEPASQKIYNCAFIYPGAKFFGCQKRVPQLDHNKRSKKLLDMVRQDLRLGSSAATLFGDYATRLQRRNRRAEYATRGRDASTSRHRARSHQFNPNNLRSITHWDRRHASNNRGNTYRSRVNLSTGSNARLTTSDVVSRALPESQTTRHNYTTSELDRNNNVNTTNIATEPEMDSIESNIIPDSIPDTATNTTLRQENTTSLSSNQTRENQSTAFSRLLTLLDSTPVLPDYNSAINRGTSTRPDTTTSTQTNIQDTSTNRRQRIEDMETLLNEIRRVGRDYGFTETTSSTETAVRTVLNELRTDSDNLYDLTIDSNDDSRSATLRRVLRSLIRDNSLRTIAQNLVNVRILNVNTDSDTSSSSSDGFSLDDDPNSVRVSLLEPRMNLRPVTSTSSNIDRSESRRRELTSIGNSVNRLPSDLIELGSLLPESRSEAPGTVRTSYTSWRALRRLGHTRSYARNLGTYARLLDKFPVTQKETSCDVSVVIDTVNAECSELTGRMTVVGLFDKLETVSTFFIGQIIDNSGKYNFNTRQWEASLEDDKTYWSKFPGFPKSWKLKIKRSNFKPKFEENEYIFMRWKELFVDGKNEKKKKTDSCDKNVDNLMDLLEDGGALDDKAKVSTNINGFYYICLSRKTGKIEGYYFATGADKQQLTLNHLGYDHSKDYFEEPVFSFMG